MPIFDLDPSQFPVRAQTGAAELVDPAILQDKQMAETLKNEKAFQLLGAAFRESNTIGSALGRQTLGVDNQPEDGFNAWNDIAGTKYEPHWKSFVSANNQRYADSIKRQIDMEEQDRRLVAAAGWRGTLASFAANTLDLPILIPGGGLVRSVKGGYSMGASALGIGAAAGVGVGVQEAALHASQETHTGQESAINIGAGVVLGSMLGAGAAGLLSRAERKVAAKALLNIETGAGAPSTELLAAIERAPPSAVSREVDVNGAVNFHVDRGAAGTTRYSASDAGVSQRARAGDVGFDAVLNQDGYFARDVVAIGSETDPAKLPFRGTRAQHELIAELAAHAADIDAPKSAGFYYDLIEDVVRGKKSVEDARAAFEAAHSAGGSAETGVQVAAAAGADTVQKLAIRDLSVDGTVADAWARTMKNVNPNLRSNYRPVAAAREYMQQLAENTVYQVAHNEGRTVGPSVETTSRVAFVSRMGEAVTAHDAAYEAMSKAGINMTHGDFEDAVGRAMRNGDADANPHVQQAAQMWRAKVFEPFKKEAIELGLLPADIPIKTAASYFSRVYNKVKLIAQEGRFKDLVTGHYSGVLADEYSQSVQAMQKRKARLGQEAADLQMSPASRMSTMKSLEEQGARLDQANAEHVARLADISDLRQKVKEARLAGDNVASQKAEQEIARIKEEGGAGLKAYQEQRSVLRQRMRNVDLGYAGIASRTDQIVQSLVNIEETNHRQLSRLVDKGRRFEREAQRLDPEKYEARKSELITSFNQVAQRADRAADRTKAAIERMQKEAAARGYAPEPPAPRSPGEPIVQTQPPIPPPDNALFRHRRAAGHASEFLGVPESHVAVQSVISELSRKLGMTVEPRVWTAYPRSPGVRGGADLHGNIFISEKLEGQQALNTALHEFGHFVETHKFNSADEATRNAITEAWRASRPGVGDKTVGQLKPVSVPSDAPTYEAFVGRPRNGKPGQAFTNSHDYQTGFSEWFAEQVSRWITTKAEPTGVVEKFFSGIADVWRSIYEKVTGHVPLTRDVDAFMRKNWRGDLIEHAAAEHEAAIERMRGGGEKGQGFTTSKGSTYELHPDGTTTRNKAARADAGHEGDSGLKPRTERTLYVDTPEQAAALSAAGVSGLGSKGARVAIKDGRATLVTWNEKAGRWGAAPSSRDIPISDTPGVGKAPLELWGRADDVPGHEAYAKMHAGNAITEVRSGQSRAADIVTKLEQHEKTQRAHAARLQRIADRLDRLENFDPEAALAEVRAGVDAAVEQISHSSLMRGEKSQRLKDRLERLDPKAVERRLKEIDATKREIDMNFYDRWGRVEGAGTKSPNFDLMARDIANDVHDALTGRRHRDDSAASHPEFFTPITRGPMKDRTFNIPDRMIEDFLESNVREVGERYARTMAGEVELTRRFGRADMRDQLTEIGHQYRDLRDAVQAAKTPEEIKGLVGRSPGFAEGLKGKLAGQDELTRSREAALSFLDKDELSARNDLTSVRDLVRGTYKVDANSGNYARVVRSVMAYNYIRHMGNFIAANWSELYRPAMVHGLGRYMSEGIAPLVKNLMRGFEGEAAASIKEAKLAGLVSERVLHARMAAFGEVADPYAKGSAFERLLFNGTKIATKWNGLAAFTDFEHSLSAIVTQNRILEAATGKAPDVRYLAYLGIDENMAKRIGAHFEKHGEVLDGNVHVANTERWGDDVAVRTYRAAVNKDVNTIIPHKGLGDIPLFCNTPTGRMMLQFRAFNMAANQRVTLRGLQESPARFVSGLVGATTMGMAAAYFTALRGGKDSYERFVKEASANPGFLIGEGLDKAGIFTLPFEAASNVQAMAGGAGFRDFNPIKSPIAAAWPGGSAPVEDRYGSSDPLSRLLGPSASIPYTLSKATGFGIKTATGGEGSKQQKKAAAMLAPYSSYYGMREVLQLLNGDSPYR